MLIAFPSDDVVWDATVTMTNEDSLYPATNVQDNDPANTAKSTTTSATFSIDISGGNVTVVGLLIVNTNATSGTLSSTAGSILSLSSFPDLTPDGKLRNKWFDLRGLSNRTEDHFEVALSKSGTAVLEAGRICLVTDYQAPEVLWAGAGSSPVFTRKRPGQLELMTRLGSTPRRASPVSPPRSMSISTLDETTFGILDQLEAECNGLLRPFLFIPDDDDTDAWFAQCAFADFEYTRDQPEVTPVRMVIQEVSMGLPPART